MISRLSLAAGGVVGFVLALLLFHLINVSVWLPAAREGGELERAVSLQKAMELIEQRSRTNAEIRNLDDAGLCRLLGRCSSTASVTNGAGFERLSPSAATRDFIISQDIEFARQVAAHNRTCETMPACRK